MADPLSSIASVITVVACAVESTGSLFKFFCGISRVPESVRQLHIALKSLHITLTALQDAGTRSSSNVQFPPHLRQRLRECLIHLEAWSTRIARINSEIDQSRSRRHQWKSKTRRSWHKVKWVMAGEQELSHFLEIIRLYHAEFSLELLTLLM